MLLKRSMSLLLLAVMTWCSVSGQSNQGGITGKITSESGEPLEFVSILLKGTRLGTTTNDLGEFSITDIPAGTYQLQVSMIGFQSISQSVKVVAGTQVQVQLKMKENTTSLQEIEIQGEVASEGLNKIDIPLSDLPITVNVVSSDLLSQLSIDELGEAVKTTSNVRPINRYGGFQTFHIRGFNNFVLLTDGVRDERHNISTSAPSTNLANVERIEVLKGPASVLFGHSALGGVINIVRNKPSTTFNANFAASYGSFNTRRLQAGAGGPINAKMSYRVDFGLSSTDGFRDYATNTNNFYMAFQYRPSKNDVLDIRVGLNKDFYSTDTGLPVLEDGTLLPNMSINARYNDPQDFLYHTRYDFQLRYERWLSNKTKVSNQLSFYWDDIDYLSTEFLEFNSTFDSLKRSFPFYFNHRTIPWQNQLEVTHDFSTGNIQHKALLGYSVSILDRKTYRGDISGPGKFTTVSIVNPILNQGDISVTDTRYQAKMENVHGIYFQDWLKFGDKWKALIGVRLDIFRGTYFDDQVDKNRNVISEGEETEIPSEALTYRAGLVYQPLDKLSFYSGFSTYFKPSRRITGDGDVFNPETGYQAEVGTRISLEPGIEMTLTGFYMRKNDIVEGLGGGIFRQIGSADSKGVEFEINASPIEGLTLRAGYGYTDARIRGFDNNDENPLAGNRIAFAPDHSANFWANYQLSKGILKGFGLGAGFNHFGDNYTSSSNTYVLPAYTVFNGSVFYNFGKGEFRLNLNNLTDKIYFRDAIYGNQFFPGQTRNYMLTLRYNL